MDRPPPTHHAILVGVNWYQTQSLRGAVPDVLEIQAFFAELIPSVQLHTFTATKRDDYPGPIEEKQQWPTTGNVHYALSGVTKNSKSGDFVYIHFSCHGTTVQDEDSPNGRALALVLLNSRGEEAYFWGKVLSGHIHNMVEKGLKVTLVLDCCFSGSVTREGMIRRIKADLDIARASGFYDEPPLPERALAASSMRDVDMMFDFKIRDTSQYALLVATGPDQEAAEVQLPGTDKYNGQLSRLLLDTLKTRSDLERSIHNIYSRVCFGFEHNRLKQHPILYGNELLPFFGGYIERTRSAPSPYHPAYFEVKWEEGGRLLLQAGKAQGISDGDEFELYASTSATDGTRPDSIIAHVSKATAFRSVLEMVDATVENLRGRSWKAIIRSQAALRKYPIKISPAVPGGDSWLDELRKRSLNAFVSSGHIESRAFLLSVDLEDGFFVFRSSDGQKVPHIPALDSSQPNIREMSDLLEHLVRFHHVKDLKNTEDSGTFENSFQVEVFVNIDRPDNATSIEGGKRKADTSQVISIGHNKKAEIIIRNEAPHDLYVSVYNLSPQWGVVNALSETFTKIATKNGPGYPKMIRKFFKMRVPEGMLKNGDTSCKDILKIFVTSHPSWMYNLQLPKLNAYHGFGESSPRRSDPIAIEENWTVMSLDFHTAL
ncbi:unnamed protein product [Clonostachys byssicola]|uniref:Peptidase C14 caspase domain-containing protein n=1 Tax=Clonostachys byssicola TaxID=160290 RepID=A0A9N9Y3E5_9HYPO|nr:unnamed protein product [Clonostachys byssicola]